MALRITIDLFSGRPNPSVVVTGLEEQEVLERIAPAAPSAVRSRTMARAAPTAAPILGYRGLIVEPVADEEQRVAPAGRRRTARSAAMAPLRVARGAVFAADGVRPARDAGVEDFVSSPAGPFRAAGLDARFYDHLSAELDRARSTASARAAAPRRVAAVAAGTDTCACAPLWDPGWWNDGGPIQVGNNCYNYAVDLRSDTFAQPGRANGAMYASISAVNVRAAALADALLDAPARNKCPRKGHLVALCVSDWDFHWYRKQRSGRWTHKPGPDPITQLDNANNVIMDPRTADRGPYTQFGGFMTVLHGRVKIA